jgi:antitoxin MazE
MGNSRGLRIPKPMIEQCGFGDTVDLRVENDCLIIAPELPIRRGWDEAFQAAGPSVDERLVDGLPPNNFDWDEWEW